MNSESDGESIPQSASEAMRPAASEALPKQVIVRHRGGFFGPIGMALALVIVGWFVAYMWITYERSAERLAAHTKAVHADRSEIKVKVERVFVDRPVEVVKEKVVVRTPDPRDLRQGETAMRVRIGERVAKVAIKDVAKLTEFQQRMKLLAETERRRVQAMVKAEIARVFNDAFADKEASLKAYSEWFFAWQRSWVVLKEAIVAAFNEIPKAGISRERLHEAVRHTIEQYLMRHYEKFVLKAELRNGPIERGLKAVFARAHDNYRAMTTKLDLKRQVFILENTRHMEDLPGDAVTVKIDWDSQKWKAPRYALEDKALQAFRSVGFMAGGALVGRTVWRPVIRRIMGQLGVRVAAANASQIEGLIGGTLLEPGVGTIVGWLGGAAVDYAYSKYDEKINSEHFIAENRKAVDETIAIWKAKAETSFKDGIDIWFADTQVVIAKEMPVVVASK